MDRMRPAARHGPQGHRRSGRQAVWSLRSKITLRILPCGHFRDESSARNHAIKPTNDPSAAQSAPPRAQARSDQRSYAVRFAPTSDVSTRTRLTHLRHKLLAAFAFDEIVLSDALEEKERAIRRPFVRNEMCSAGGNLVAVSDFKRVLIIGITCIYGERATKYKVVISTLAVAMPGNNLTGRQREYPRLNVDTFRDHFNIFDRIIGLRSRFFCWHGKLLPRRRQRYPNCLCL